MIWAILILLGIPLWLIVIALINLIRARSQVKHLPGSFEARGPHSARWQPFLIATTPYGVTDMLEGPAISASDPRLKRMAQPVSLLLRTDSEDVIELVCPAASVETARWSFGSASTEP